MATTKQIASKSISGNEEKSTLGATAARKDGMSRGAVKLKAKRKIKFGSK
jgi:hypothetical protein